MITKDNAIGTDWQILHAGIIAPLAPVDVGEDPRYSDNFSQLKSEMEKRNDVRYETIFALSCDVLCNTAKDLRVAGYLLLSASRLQGLAGFYEALRAYHALLIAFGKNTHPIRDSARLAAVRWLFQDKILTFTRNNTESPTYELVCQTQDEFKRFIDLLFTLTDEPTSWPEFSKWLKQLETELKPPAKQNKVEETPNTQQTTASQPPVANVAEPSTDNQPSNTQPPSGNGKGAIRSDQDLQNAMRALLSYLREQQQFGALVSVARSLKWRELKLPPNDSGKTKLSAPRVPSINRIKTALDNEQWVNALLAAEDAFLEPGGIFCLDIQRLAHQAASKGGLKPAAAAIAGHVRDLLERLPKITQLKFDNDEPFISPQTISWIEQLANTSSAESTGQIDLLTEARQVSEQEGLNQGLQWLKHISGQGLLHQLRVRLAQAQLCMEHDQTTLARPLLAELSAEVERYKIAQLEPELAMRIWRQYQFALQNQLTESLTEDRRLALQDQLDALQAQLCSTDITLATQWL